MFFDCECKGTPFFLFCKLFRNFFTFFCNFFLFLPLFWPKITKNSPNRGHHHRKNRCDRIDGKDVKNSFFGGNKRKNLIKKRGQSVNLLSVTSFCRDVLFYFAECPTLIPNNRQPLPHAAGDKPPEEDDELKAPVEDDDAATAPEASQNMAGGCGGGHKHGIALIGVKNLGSHEARADVAKLGREVVHAHILRECREVGALHRLGCRVGRS